MPGMTHWQSPSFFAYYPAGSSTAGLLGDMLSAALNCIGFSWIASPAATELETLTLDWLGQLLSLPKQFLNTGSGTWCCLPWLGQLLSLPQKSSGTASEAILEYATFFESILCTPYWVDLVHHLVTAPLAACAQVAKEGA